MRAEPRALGSREVSQAVIFLNFVDKWLSADGVSSVIVQTNDAWSTIEGRFQ